MPKEIKKESEKIPASSEPKIYVMPERFLGVEPGKKPVERVADTTAPVKKKRAPLMPIIVAIVVILVLGGGGTAAYFIFLKDKGPALIVKDEPEVVTPPSIAEPEPSDAEAAEGEEEEGVSSEDSSKEEEKPIVILDTDGDGLTDIEEAVYGSNITDPDTDSDGFLDGHEVFHLYNPVGLSPVRLLDTGSVKEYVNSQRQYQIYFPSPWSVQVVDDTAGTVMFSSGTGEFIEVLIEKNDEDLPIVSWYLSRAPGVRAGELETFVTKSNLDGIKSTDRRTAYFTKNGLVFIISYNIGTKTDVNYRRTFEMMLNSLQIL